MEKKLTTKYCLIGQGIGFFLVLGFTPTCAFSLFILKSKIHLVHFYDFDFEQQVGTWCAELHRCQKTKGQLFNDGILDLFII